MHEVLGGLRRPCGLLPLSLTIVALSIIVVRAQDIDDCDHISFEGGTCDAKAFDMLAGSSDKDIRSSLIQVTKSKMHTQVVDSGESEANTPDSPTDNAASLLALMKDLDTGAVHHPALWILVLVIIAAACIVTGIVRAVNENMRDEKYEHSFARGPTSPPTATSLSPAPLPGSVRHMPVNPHSQLQMNRDSPMPAARPATGIPMAAAKHLCPGLVVPHGNECILAVPTLPISGSPGLDVAALNVQDLDGKSVIQADVVLPNSARASVAMTQRPLVVLRAGSAPRNPGQPTQPLLAYCKASHEMGSRKSVYIYDARDELFAQIVKDPSNSRYVLTSGRVSLRLFFEGEILSHTVAVTNDQHQLVAETTPSAMAFNPSGSFYKLRVVSNIDVGLILCALFAIDCMELS
jgi:hypothetical protein